MANLTVLEPIRSCHVVVMPYPGRGHINPIMNLCKLIASRRANILITFIVTEEWLGFIGSEPKPANIRFRTIPNVIPSELVRSVDFPGFIEATLTKLEGPVELLLDGLETPASVIVYDAHLTWVVGVGNRRNIPVASFWPMSATVFSMLHHYELFVQNGHAQVTLSEQGEELVNYIPGVPSTRVADLPTPFYGKGHEVLPRVLEAISWIPRAQYLLFSSIYELEAPVIDALKAKFPIPIYSIGPALPYFKLEDNFLHKSEQNESDDEVTRWLDNQPKSSVLYISQGSFLSVSSAQLDEIVAGVKSSGVRYLWIARAEASRFKEGNIGGKGLVVPWCDQLKVLCHSSIGGFWSHCGWNSTKEAAFAGVPVLTFPIFWDQVPDSKMIVDDWKTGRRVMRGETTLITKEEIAELVKKFMDLESDKGKEMRKRAQELKEISHQAIAKGGSAEMSIDAFISDISGCHN